MNRPLQFIAPALAVLALAAALFAVPADEARAHTDNSAKLHAKTNPLHEAAQAGDLDSVNHFLAAPHAVAVDAKDDDGETPLHKAAAAGRLSVVATLIAAGANVTVKSLYGDAPLHFAVYGGVAVVATLIAEGAAVDMRGENGWTALHHAAYGGYSAVAAALIAAGAAVDLRENNGDETPLYQAAERGHLSVVAALIKAGADVNVRGYFNLAPLHEAAGDGRLTVALTLIAAGADVNAKDDGGETPLLKAETGGHPAVVSALVAAGGHWGTACAKPAVVNPAGSSQPCLCKSPNVGTPDNCACPAGQALLADETCGVCPAEHRILADETCSACPVGQLLKDGACAAPATPEEKCQAAQWTYHSATGVCGIKFTIGDSVDHKTFCRFDSAKINLNPFCREVFGPAYSFPHKPADGSSPIYVYNCDPDGSKRLRPATVNTAGATACSCSVAGQTLRADLGKCVPRAALTAEIEKDKPNLAIVRSLLKQGVDPNLTVSAGVPLLFVAATLLHAEVVSVLITAGANPSVRFGVAFGSFHNSAGTPRTLPGFLTEHIHMDGIFGGGNFSVGRRFAEVIVHFGNAAGGRFDWDADESSVPIGKNVLYNLANYQTAATPAEQPFLRGLGAYVQDRMSAEIDCHTLGPGDISYRDSPVCNSRRTCPAADSGKIYSCSACAGLPLRGVDGVSCVAECGRNAEADATTWPDTQCNCAPGVEPDYLGCRSDHDPALIEAVQASPQNLVSVRSLLDLGARPNITTSAGVPLLFVAATLLHAEVVSVLITAGANVSAQFGLSATRVNSGGAPRPLPRFLSEQVYAGNAPVGLRLEETYFHFGAAAGGAYDWRLADGDTNVAHATLGNLALYYATISANPAADAPFLRRIGGYLRGVGGQCPSSVFGEDISNSPVCVSPLICPEWAPPRGEICVPKRGDFGEGLSDKFLCGIFGGEALEVEELPASAVQFRLHLHRVAQSIFPSAERAMIVAMSNVVQAKFDGNSATVAAFLSAYDTGGAKYDAGAYKEIIFRANLAYDPTGTFQDPRIHTGIFSEANSNELARILSFVPVDGSVYICAGMDKNDTFCMLNSAEAFPCRGLFNHLRACNVAFNRPALNPFFCGAKCPDDKKAVGSECE